MRRLLSAIVLCAFLVGASSGAAADPLLPDLGMAKIDTVVIDTTTIPGRTLLRYTAILVNVGSGPLELVGSRSDTSTPEMTVMQRVYDASGASTDTPVDTTMFYAGDGHEHWHVKDIEGGTLSLLSNETVGSLAKHGFCFSDNVRLHQRLRGAPRAPHYTDPCQRGHPEALAVDVGISVGWGDAYPATTSFQWIDITGLPNGKYLLTATADPGQVLHESNYANNSTWVKLKIKGTRVRIIGSARRA